MHQLGVELATFRSQVRRASHYTTEPPSWCAQRILRGALNTSIVLYFYFMRQSLSYAEEKLSRSNVVAVQYYSSDSKKP